MSATDGRAVSLADARVLDWEQVERLPEFRDLVARRRRFVAPATVFFLAWYFGFIVLAGYAPGFMGESVYEGLTLGYVLALTQFAMVAGLGLAYLRYSSRELDPLRERVVLRAAELGLAEPAAPSELESDAFHTERRGRRFRRAAEPVPERQEGPR
jgi:uncharacterized membrane protein (DUF485 family)